MRSLRMPDGQFVRPEDFSWMPRELAVQALDGASVRLRYIDEGRTLSVAGSVVRPTLLLLHGESTWGYHYRQLLPSLVNAGWRVVVPDLVGSGRSDKPQDIEWHSIEQHVLCLEQLLHALTLNHVILFGAGIGGMLGAHLVARDPERFAGVVMANVIMPTGDQSLESTLDSWCRFVQDCPILPVSQLVQQGCMRRLPATELASYDAPYLCEEDKALLRAIPAMLPDDPDTEGAEWNRRAWQALFAYDRPWLTLYSDMDPVTRGGEALFQQLVPGAAAQKHAIIYGAGHFVVEDAASAIAGHLFSFFSANGF